MTSDQMDELARRILDRIDADTYGHGARVAHTSSIRDEIGKYVAGMEIKPSRVKVFKLGDGNPYGASVGSHVGNLYNHMQAK